MFKDAQGAYIELPIWEHPWHVTTCQKGKLQRLDLNAPSATRQGWTNVEALVNFPSAISIWAEQVVSIRSRARWQWLQWRGINSFALTDPCQVRLPDQPGVLSVLFRQRQLQLVGHVIRAEVNCPMQVQARRPAAHLAGLSPARAMKSLPIHGFPDGWRQRLRPAQRTHFYQRLGSQADHLTVSSAGSFLSFSWTL